MKIDGRHLARWRREPIGFIEEVLIDPETGKPFVLLPAERIFTEHAFKIGPDGRLLYPELIYACPKKSGKTTFGAALVITFVLLFGGRYGEGVCCANDQEQAAGRVFQQAKRIIQCSPLLCGEAKITADRITIADASITAVANDAAGAAGGNQCCSAFDELWGFTSEKSRRLFDEMVPPPTRAIACRLTVTYAGFEGESALLEELYKRGLQQRQIAPSLYAGDGILMFWSHVPIAPWQTEAWLAEMRRSLRPNQYLRMIENRFVSSETSFIEMSAWDRCVDERLSPAVADPLLPVFVGVDGAWKRDSAAIVATTWDAKAQQVRLIYHRIFVPTSDDPIDFERDIEGTLLDLHRRFSIRKLIADPHLLQASLQRLARLGLPIEELPQGAANLTMISQNLYELITGQTLAAYPDASIRLAVSRAIASETPRGWKIDKARQAHRIDVVIALAMAAKAAVDGQASAPPLWQRSAFLTNGRPVPVPTRAHMLFTTLVVGKSGDVGISYFAYSRVGCLHIIDCERARLTPLTFAKIKDRLNSYAQTMQPITAVAFTSRAIADMARRQGFQGVEEMDALLADELIAVRAAVHVNEDKVRVCPDVSGYAFLFGMADRDDPLQMAVMAGVVLALDEDRDAQRRAA
jgi:hypothetical protein